MSITAISPTPGLSTSSHHQFTLSNRLSLLSLPFSRPNRPISLPGGGNFIARTNVFVHFETKTLLHKPHRLAFTFSTRAADSTQPSAVSASPDKAVVTDDEFSLAKVSFGVIGLGVGVSLLSYGFGAYFNILPGSEWSAIMLTYGFPLAIIGMALKYAELKPVPCLTYLDAQKLRETCATPILKQVRDDVIRFRYGDEQHLDEALKRIFQYGLAGGIPRRSAPILESIREEVTEDGKYCLVLVFEAKALTLSDFEQRQAKFASFFGPGITAEVGKGENDLYEVRLISNSIPGASP
ncbi:thylakoid membrane protein [Cucumis melo var. makuwa]|uniref:Thylakoid membrane protein n=1 Tax=Cucumis melo var. makuwa TaxID=1194695 RepID=A0A5A7TDN5_CUCMM|nr:thylakoid membrane protein [Cucumis melo var. makuwa]TYK00567.1 thylakoid membrane protein [Cucumis melo var. makuwa]